MLRRHVPWSLAAVALGVVVLLLFHWPTQKVAAQPERQYPVFVIPGNVGLQVNLQRGAGPFPGTANGTPVYLAAQLIRNAALQPPFQNIALPLAPLSSAPLTAASASQSFSENCGLTHSNTMLECILTPNPGPNWSAGGPILIRVRLSSTDGYVGAALLNFPIN